MKLFFFFSIVAFLASMDNRSRGLVTEANIGVVLSIIMALTFFFHLYHIKQIQKFMFWLMDHKEDFKSDPDKVIQLPDETPVTYNTPLTQYTFCTGFIFICFKHRTGYMVGDSFFKPFVCLTANLFSLLTGWWGIPFGIPYMVQCFKINSEGGIRQTVGDLIRELEGE